MSDRIRRMTVELWILAVLFVATAGGVYALTSYLDDVWEEAADPLIRPLSTVPVELEGFQGRDLQMSQNVLDALDAQDWIKRVYHDGVGRNFVIYVGYFADLSIMKSHSPEVCYPGAGWEIRARETTVLEGADGETLEVSLLEFSKHGERRAVINWFLTWGGGQGPDGRGQVAEACALDAETAGDRASSGVGRSGGGRGSADGDRGGRCQNQSRSAVDVTLRK